jgi:hypothetical protein
MPDVEDDNDEALLIDLVENAPLPGEASTVDAGELFAERSAHALRIREQWPCDQFDGCDCHVMRQQFGERATRRGSRRHRQRLRVSGVRRRMRDSNPRGRKPNPLSKSTSWRFRTFHPLASSGQERDCELGPPGSGRERPRMNERTPDRTC